MSSKIKKIFHVHPLIQLMKRAVVPDADNQEHEPLLGFLPWFSHYKGLITPALPQYQELIPSLKNHDRPTTWSRWYDKDASQI